MQVTNKTVGFGIMAVAGLMLCTAAIADSMGKMDGMGMGMGGGMMRGPMMDLTAMDADKDGKISKDEVAAYRAAQTASVDANGDGKLSVDELAALHLKGMTEAFKARATQMVADLDTDGDGLLSVAELAARPMPGAIFDRVDGNKDGFVDQAEIDAARQAMMERGQGRGGHRGGMHGGHDGKGPDHDGPDQNGMGGN